MPDFIHTWTNLDPIAKDRRMGGPPEGASDMAGAREYLRRHFGADELPSLDRLRHELDVTNAQADRLRAANDTFLRIEGDLSEDDGDALSAAIQVYGRQLGTRRWLLLLAIESLEVAERERQEDRD